MKSSSQSWRYSLPPLLGAPQKVIPRNLSDGQFERTQCPILTLLVPIQGNGAALAGLCQPPCASPWQWCACPRPTAHKRLSTSHIPSFYCCSFFDNIVSVVSEGVVTLSSPPSSMRTGQDQDSPEVLQMGTQSARAKFKQLSQRRTRPPQEELGHMGGMW